MLTKLIRPIVSNGVPTSLIAFRPLSISNRFFQDSSSKSSSTNKSSKTDDKSLVEHNKNEKVLRVEDSLKDLASVKWRTEYNGKRLWPHDQWPERDLVNFPPYKLREAPNAVRWYCVPETWFKFFYDKTGVTGPYMFFYGLLVYGFSKEYIVLWYDFTEYLILAAAVITVVKKVGPMVGDVFRGWHQEEVDRYTSVVNNSKAMAGKMLHGYEESLARAKNVGQLADARKDIINMALETAYRDRLRQMYEAVKRRLDYQVALQNARKDFERTNMINWITNEVRKSITNKQEQDTLQACLNQLRQIASQTR
jgi:F-type H+-transporting ATPase subunit b